MAATVAPVNAMMHSQCDHDDHTCAMRININHVDTLIILLLSDFNICSIVVAAFVASCCLFSYFRLGHFALEYLLIS